MQIQPNTTIKLLSKVPLDNSYRNTIYFATATAQQNFFNSKVRYTLDRQTFQRVGRGKMNIHLPYENFYNINYLMFQNTSFNTKWFYAFIVKVEYINNNVTEITYEIDELQTWLFEMQLKECYVEREHSVTDTFPDDCLVPENLGTGNEYVNNKLPQFVSFGKRWIGMYALPKNGFLGHMQNNVFTEAFLFKYDTTSTGFTGQIETDIASYSEDGKLDYIINMFMFNDVCFGNTTSFPAGDHTITFSDNLADTLDGYRPKNKKLYTYPYNYCLIDNNAGTSAVYKFEYSDNDDHKLTFKIEGSLATQPMIQTYPTNYANVVNNYENALVNGEVVECAFIGNAFSNWIANNKLSLTLSAIQGGVSLATGLIGGKALYASAGSVGMSMLNNGATAQASLDTAHNIQAQGIKQMVNSPSNIAGLIAQIGDASVSPATIKGKVMTNGFNYAVGRDGVTVYTKCVNHEIAKSIDDYFTRFGYATNRLKIPNINSRPHWNYVKTAECTVVGDIPVDSVATICNAFNSGITWWKNGNNVGNYELDNSPT